MQSENCHKRGLFIPRRQVDGLEDEEEFGSGLQLKATLEKASVSQNPSDISTRQRCRQSRSLVHSAAPACRHFDLCSSRCLAAQKDDTKNTPICLFRNGHRPVLLPDLSFRGRREERGSGGETSPQLSADVRSEREGPDLKNGFEWRRRREKTRLYTRSDRMPRSHSGLCATSGSSIFSKREEM